MTRPSYLMAPMDAAADAARNQLQDAPDTPFTVDFATDVLADIRQSAAHAFRLLPYGGLEIGGVLFGRVLPDGRTPRRIEVAASRLIECSHAAGPVFILSGAERVRLTQLFERARQEEELAALCVVGFWVSHGRSELGLTLNDADLYRAFFPHSWQIALMLKPENSRPLREALFCRVDGKVSLYKRPAEPAVALVETSRGQVPVSPAPEIIPEVKCEEAAVISAAPADELPGAAFREPEVHEQALDHPANFQARAWHEQALQEQESEERPLPAETPIEQMLEPPKTEPQRFATDIYVPTPPVEPPSTRTWAKDLYRPSGRVRALVQPPPLTEPAPESWPAVVSESTPAVPEPDYVSELPRLRSYWETEPTPETPLTLEPGPSEAPVEQHPEPEAAWEEAAKIEPTPDTEPILHGTAMLDEVETVSRYFQPAWTRAAEPPVVEEPIEPESASSTPPAPELPSEVEAPPAPVPVAAKPKVEIYIPPVAQAKEPPPAPPPLPDATQSGDELARLLTSVRSAGTELRKPRVPEIETLPRLSHQGRHSFGVLTMIALLLAGILIGGVLGFWFFGNHQGVAAKASGPDLGLEMFNTGKEVLLHWNAKSAAALNARAAELRVQDNGMLQTISLDLSALSKGYYRYEPGSSDLQATLIVTATNGHTDRSNASRFAQ